MATPAPRQSSPLPPGPPPASMPPDVTSPPVAKVAPGSSQRPASSPTPSAPAKSPSRRVSASDSEEAATAEASSTPSSSLSSRRGSSGSSGARSKAKRSPASATGGGGRSGGGGSMSRINQLYASHAETQEKRRKQRALEAQSPRGCTFQPKLEKRLSRSSDKFRTEAQMSKLSKKKASRGKADGAAAAESRFERLYAGHKATQEKIARARAAKLDEKCTFKPRINKPRKKTSDSSSPRSLGSQKTGGSRYDMLYKTASAYELKRQKSMQTLGMEECTFSPRTNTRRRAAPKNRSPLYDGEAIRMAQDLRDQKRRELELKNCTFEPNINRRGGNQSTTADGTEVGERLYKNAENLRQKRLKASMDAAAKEEVECTFKPKLATKRSMLNMKTSPSVGETAFERLYGNAQKQREAREAAMQRASSQYEFQPKINGKSRELARHSDDRSLHEYLYKEGLAKTLQRQSQGDYRTTMRHRLEEEELELCTFDPKLWKNEEQRKRAEAKAAAEKSHRDKIALEALELEKKRALLAEQHFQIEQEREKEAERQRNKELAEAEAMEQEAAKQRAAEFAEKAARAEQRKKTDAAQLQAHAAPLEAFMDSLHAKRTVLVEDEGVDNQENNTDDDAAAVDDEDEMW